MHIDVSQLFLHSLLSLLIHVCFLWVFICTHFDMCIHPCTLAQVSLQVSMRSNDGAESQEGDCVRLVRHSEA